MQALPAPPPVPHTSPYTLTHALQELPRSPRDQAGAKDVWFLCKTSKARCLWGVCKQERSSFPELYSSPWTDAGRDHGGPASPAGPSPAHGAAQSSSRSPRGPRSWEGSEQSGQLPSENTGIPVPGLAPQAEEAGGSSFALSPRLLQRGQQSGGGYVAGGQPCSGRSVGEGEH